MTLFHSITAFFLLMLPWLNPFALGPSLPVLPWLVALMASAGLLLLEVARGTAPQQPDRRTFAQRWAGPFAWALVAAGLVSSMMGLLQYFGVAAALEPWVRPGTSGEAFANLRQRNQFASLTNMALVALIWLVMTGRSQATVVWIKGSLNLHRTGVLFLAAALLAAGNAASSSRTGLLQLFLVCVLFWMWGGWRLVAVRGILLVAVAIYGVSSLLLPLIAGLDPSEHGILARLRDGAPACSSRWLLWSNVLHLIAEKPWSGWGWGELDYAHYVTLYPGERFCEILDNAHNLPLHLAVELGVPLALLICGGMTWWVWRRRPWKETDATRQMAWGVLAVIGLHSLLEYPLWYGPFQMAAVLCMAVLWRRKMPLVVSEQESNWPLAQIFQGLSAMFLIVFCAVVAWDYHRISQIYLAPSARDAAYRDDTLAKSQGTWFFSQQVLFAELNLTPLTRANAQWTFDAATLLLHFSPESRVIEKVIESATLLGRDDEALFYLARYRAAFPVDHARWAQSISK